MNKKMGWVVANAIRQKCSICGHIYINVRNLFTIDYRLWWLFCVVLLFFFFLAHHSSLFDGQNHNHSNSMRAALLSLSRSFDMCSWLVFQMTKSFSFYSRQLHISLCVYVFGTFTFIDMCHFSLALWNFRGPFVHRCGYDRKDGQHIKTVWLWALG